MAALSPESFSGLYGKTALLVMETLWKQGVCIDIPPGVSLLRSRMEMANASLVRDRLTSIIIRTGLLARLEAYLHKTGEETSIPYDYFKNRKTKKTKFFGIEISRAHIEPNEQYSTLATKIAECKAIDSEEKSMVKDGMKALLLETPFDCQPEDSSLSLRKIKAMAPWRLFSKSRFWYFFTQSKIQGGNLDIAISLLWSS